MSRHQHYSKRSRESRKARTDGTVVEDAYSDCQECMVDEWSPLIDDASLPQHPAI